MYPTLWISALIGASIPLRRSRNLAKTSLLRHGWWPLIHGDQATWLIELSKRAVAPAGLEKETIDLIHANHYFTMPLVEKIRAGKRIPKILDTHDIQARHTRYATGMDFSSRLMRRLSKC